MVGSNAKIIHRIHGHLRCEVQESSHMAKSGYAFAGVRFACFYASLVSALSGTEHKQLSIPNFQTLGRCLYNVVFDVNQ